MNSNAVEKLGVKPLDIADHLQSDEDWALYLHVCQDMAPVDAVLFWQVLAYVARASTMYPRPS